MKYIIIGSAWYITDWLKHNHSSDAMNQSCIVAINNSMSEISKYRLVHRWYTGTDFFIKKQLTDPSFNLHVICNNYKFGYSSIITGDFLFHPHGYYDPLGGTMIINVCYDLLNKSVARNHPIKIGIIGCDLIYNRSTSHFYEGGADDPMRLGIENLKSYLLQLNSTFQTTGNQIYNLSENSETLLPFDRISLKEF